MNFTIPGCRTSWLAACHYLALALLLASAAARAADARDDQPQDPVAEVGRASDSYFNGSYADAIRRAGRFTQCGDVHAEAFALHWQARAYFERNIDRDRRSAASNWRRLARLSRRTPSGRQLLAVTRAITFTERGDQQSATRTLDVLLESEELRPEIELEARLLLANLLAKSGDKDAAEEQLEHVARALRRRVSLGIQRTWAGAFQRGLELTRQQMRAPGVKAYRRARALFAEEHYREALHAFDHVIAAFPESVYADRSQLGAARCLQQIGREDLAARRLERFVADAPSGRFRGQAHLQLMDMALTSLQWREASERAALASESVAAGLASANDDCKDSWKQVVGPLLETASAIDVSDGELSGSLARAIDYFAHRQGMTADRLRRLKEQLGDGRDILPESVVRRDGDATPLLRLAVARMCLGRWERAEAILAELVPLKSRDTPKHRTHPASQDQKAFALVLMARIAFERGDNDLAIARCRSALRLSDRGSWHSEARYVIARAMDRKSQAQAPRAWPAKPRAISGDTLDAEPLDHKALRALLEAWELVIRNDLDAREHEATARYAQLLAIMGQTERASELWSGLIESAPDSPHLGPAHAQMIRLELHGRFDVDAACERARGAVEWAERSPGGEDRTAGEPAPIWALPESQLSGAEVVMLRKQIMLTSGLAHYLNGERNRAIAVLRQAGARNPVTDGKANPDLEAIGAGFLLQTIVKERALTDAKALQATENERQATALRIANLYIGALRFGEAEEILNRVLNSDPVFDDVPADVRAYAGITLSTAITRQQDREEEAIELLSRLARQKSGASTHWTGIAAFREALFTFNHTQDPARSVPLYKRFVQQYPDHEVTELALFYMCLDAEHADNLPDARWAASRLVEKYPSSSYVTHVRAAMRRLSASSNQESDQ